MALPSSGQITLTQVNVELGNSGTAQINMNSAAVRGLFDVASGQITMANGHGKSSVFTLTNEGTINGQSNRKQITVSSFISSGGTLLVPSNFWVWSDDTSIPAIIIDIACTIENFGKIIGKGGTNNGTDGSSAIKINSGVSGVTIVNKSGSYIAGGGGGGGQGQNSGGGGGAGGGYSGLAASTLGGGVLNAAGSNGVSVGGTSPQSGYGGGSGGGGGGVANLGGGFGGGGGRILTGTGGAAGAGAVVNGRVGNGGAGGSGSSAGANATGDGAGGGGGWGASGGNGFYLTTTRLGGDGGKAVDDSGVSYTLTNNGTIYGGT